MLECDVCLSKLVMKDDGSGAACPVCGVVYTIERLRRKLAAASSSVPVTYPSLTPQKEYDSTFDVIDGCLASYWGRKVDVVIPDGIESIGPSAFAEKSFIETVVIPNSVTRIHESAFEKCKNLHTVYIGTGVRKIGLNAFFECYKLRAVHITDLSAWCEIEFDSKVMYSSPLLVAGHLYLNGREVTELTIPEGVTLRQSAFAGCLSLTSVTIPAHIKISGSYNLAFNYCTNLRFVRFEGTPCNPESLQCQDMFSGCENLQTVHFAGKPCKLRVPAGCRVTSAWEIARAMEEEHIRASRRAAGLCQYCGGKFGVFGQTCTSCKAKKDYR